MKNTAISKSKVYIMPIIMMIGLGLVLFLPAGSLRYWQAWVYWTTFLIPTLFITVYFFKRNPELLARRWQVKDQETVRKIPALLHIPWTVIRIKNEEELLLRDLYGYQDYCTKTLYRLIPSVW